MPTLPYSAILTVYKQRMLWFIGCIFFIALWWMVSSLSLSNTIPNPLTVVISGREVLLSGVLLQHIFASLWRVLVGFSLAFGSAGILWFCTIIWPTVRAFFRPIIELIRPIPPIAWIPLVIYWFGLGDTPAFVIVAIGAFFPILTNLFSSLDAIPTVYKQVADSFEISRLRWFRQIVLPFSKPHLYTGIRTGVGMAWMCVIAAELIGAQSGLGYFIQLNRLLLRTDLVIVGMLTIGVIGGALSLMLGWLEHHNVI